MAHGDQSGVTRLLLLPVSLLWPDQRFAVEILVMEGGGFAGEAGEGQVVGTQIVTTRIASVLSGGQPQVRTTTTEMGVHSSQNTTANSLKGEKQTFSGCRRPAAGTAVLSCCCAYFAG